MKRTKAALSGIIIAVFLCLIILNTKTANAATTQVLMVGSTGSQVSQLQQNLKTLGYFNYGSITGYYGTVTESSVIKFQKANNLAADGIAGQQTLYKISQLVNNYSTSLYTVKSGDSLFTIAMKFGTTIVNLKALNNLWTDTIYPGQVLKIGTSTQDISGAYNESLNPDLYWLSRIIEAEASGEPYIGKVAVGSVILNRAVSPDFPDTVKGVIFEYYNGIPQFSPVAEGTIYNNPSSDSIKAAFDAINGSRPAGTATYFFNPDKSSASWIVSNKTYVTQIGSHVFYK